MAVSADATFSGTVLLCPFSLEQPHDIARLHHSSWKFPALIAANCIPAPVQLSISVAQLARATHFFGTLQHRYSQGDYNQGVSYSGSGYSHKCFTTGELVRSL
jgi:hypothetical protein